MKRSIDFIFDNIRIENFFSFVLNKFFVIFIEKWINFIEKIFKNQNRNFLVKLRDSFGSDFD